MKHLYFKLSFCLILLSLLSPFKSIGQNNDSLSLIQVTGLIVEAGDSLYGIPGAHIFNPLTGRGATSNLMGYFSMAVKPGDSLLVASIGYMKQPYIISRDSARNYSIIFQLVNDTIFLPEIHIGKLPAEKAFKQAFLALHLPEEDYNNMNSNLDKQLLINLFGTTNVDQTTLARYRTHQQAKILEQKYIAQSISLLDPFAWSRFVKEVKSIKRKKENKEKHESEKRKEEY